MIPAILLGDVRPVPALRSAGEDRNAALRLLPQFDLGDILSARIEARLPDGSFRVLVAGQALSMALPSYVAPGDTLDLALVAREPRLTFVLREAPQQVTAPVLSEAGRLVAATMTRQGGPAMAVSALQATPLLDSMPAGGQTLSAALEHTLAQSGLFYESHQAEWLAGRRALAQLLTEPQARLAQVVPRREAGAATTAAMIELPGSAPAHPSQQLLHPQAVPLVQQQLAALDSASVVLRVQIWPGQWMQWEIDEHDPGASRGPDAPQSWNTQLRMQLPHLGELNASLALGGEGMHIRLEAASAGSAALLIEHRAALQAALAGAGVSHANIAIAHHARS